MNRVLCYPIRAWSKEAPGVIAAQPGELLLDPYRTKIDCLRISVTEQCNLGCIYCSPQSHASNQGETFLSVEEIRRVVVAAAEMGIAKVRLTGGEPLSRPDIVELVGALASVPGVADLSLTTNGILLSKYARDLVKAGLRRVNVNLVSLKPRKFAMITGSDQLQKVLQGIEAATEVGLYPIKINTVVMKGINDDELADLARLTIDNYWHVRFIELMPSRVDPGGRLFHKEHYMPISQLQARWGELEAVEKPVGNGPARYWRLPFARGSIGFISPLSEAFCHHCNRLRLTSKGRLHPCLFCEPDIDLTPTLQRRGCLSAMKQLLALAVSIKPRQRWAHQAGTMAPMRQVGG